MCEGWDSMPYIDVTNWNCGSGTNFDQMFAWALKLEKLEGLKNWDVSNATSMARMFYASVGLKEIDVTGWDVSNVKAINGFICSEHQNSGDMQLEKAIGFTTWNLENVESIGSLFYGCGQLKEVDLSGWNLPKLTSATHMFADCYKLESVDLTGWNTPSLVSMDAMFNDCRSLKSVDLSSFDTSNVNYFCQLFEVCYALEEVIGLENFDTSKGDNFSEMFSGCGKLKELDLSSFDTRNADHLKEGDWVFLRFITGCTGLEKITFGPYFDFDGVGCADGYKFVMPAASNVEGWDGKWYTADGTGYLPSEIPEMTAATYYAVNPLKPATPPVDSTNP
jgi:surface protein